MQSPPVPCSLVPLGLKYSQPMFPPQCERPSFQPYTRKAADKQKIIITKSKFANSSKVLRCRLKLSEHRSLYSKQSVQLCVNC